MKSSSTLQQRIIQFPDATISTGPFNLSFVQSTQTSWHLNGVYQALAKTLGHKDALRSLIRYNCGTALWHGGSTIFWYLHSDDPRDGFTAGDIFKIDPHTGSSVDESYTTVHLLLEDKYGVDAGKEPHPSLVGCHLVYSHPERPVVIVPRPFDAILASHFLGDNYNFLALPEHNLVDLNCPAYIPAMPTLEPVLLLGDGEIGKQWKHDLEHIQSWVSHKGRSVHYMDATDLFGYCGSIGQTIMNNH